MGAPKDCLSLKRLGASMVATFGLTAMSVLASNDVPHEEKGYQKSSYGLSEYESINLASGNLTFRVPLHTLKTDGGLEYPVTAYFNSKFWATRRYCNLSYPVDSCGENGGEVSKAEIANGVEAYGFGWDLRPPRIQSPTPASLRQAPAFVAASGRRHFFHSAKPWLEDSRSEFDGFAAAGDQYFTGDGTNYRFTVQSIDGSDRATQISMEDGQGNLYIFGHIVPNACNKDLTEIDASSDLDDYNFKTEIVGLYLSEIQRGPWMLEGSDAVPANRIVFAYRGNPNSWDASCADSPNEPWLVSSITAEGETDIDRVVTFHYSTGALTSIDVPAFDPTLGSTSVGSSAAITWTTDEPSFSQAHGASTEAFDATHLTRIQFSTGEPLTFDQDVGATFLPLHDVTLPSGALISYERSNAYPVGCATWVQNPTRTGEFLVYYCGSEVSPTTKRPGVDPSGTRCERTFGVTSRTIEYSDASGPRTEKTWFRQQLNCTAKVGFDVNGDNSEWPYDFSFALRDSLDNPGETAFPEYLWTIVASQEGGGDFLSLAPVGEIHRFHRLTREEFSIDHLSGSGVINLLGWAILGSPHKEPLSEIADLRVVRHQETERSVLEGHLDIKNYDWHRDRYTYISRQETFTDENADSTIADIKRDTDPCYPDVPPGTSPPDSSCAEVETLSTVDQYLNPASSHTESIDSAVDPEVDRWNEWTYDTTNPEDPYVWSLGRQVSSKTYDDVDTNPTTTVVRTWTNLSGAGTDIQHYYVVQTEVSNPDVNGNCTGDCVEHTYLYDDLGHLWKDTLSGGFGTGFGSLNTTTETTYKHGAAQKKTFLSGSDSLLLWEREIDPNTGLPRWHVGGSGIGFAYLWDALGRPTDIAPIDGVWTDTPPGFRVSAWYLNHQKTGPAGETSMVGVHIDYLSPTSNSLLENRVYDATWSGDLLSGSLPSGTTGTLRAKALFDGLGRLTRESEAYPQGMRSRYHLRFVHDPTDDFEVCDTNHSWDIPDKSKVTLDSEWVHGETFSVDCDLPWTETQLDALGRAAVQELPDGSLTRMAFVGDTTTTTTRAIVTNIDASGNAGATDLPVVAITDALGRLRRIEEEVTTNSFFRTDYAYDQSDRLIKVALFEPGATPTYSQMRTWAYSGAGFLTNSTEPEREIDLTGYDAAGNVTEQTRVGSGITHTNDFDAFGRYLKTEEDGQTLIEQSWSAAAIGVPSYNSTIESRRHNRFGASDVAVTHHWTYGGPGGRVSARTTEVDGLGAPGDAFEIGYGYDAWGNRSELDLPRWNGCRHSAIETISSTFDGPWAESIGIIDTLGNIETLGEATYHPTGRIHELTYETWTTPQVVWEEVPDDHGMARPKSIGLSGGNPVLGIYGTVAGFSYDDAGNLWRVGGKRYFYDGLNRLLGEKVNQSGRAYGPSQEYEYDRWGNATTVKSYTTVGTLESQLTFAMEKVNQVPTTNRVDTVDDDLARTAVSLTWDGRGNLEHQPAIGPLREKEFDWSEDDRLMQSTDDPSGTPIIWRYAYDAAGERVLKWHDAGTGTEATASVRDEAGKTVSEWRNIAGTDDFKLITDYLYLGARQIAELSHQTAPDRVHYMSPDHLGSPKVLFDDDGEIVDWMEFEPFGALRGSSGSTPETSHLFTGHERDLGTGSSELDYMHARYYSPGLARFVSVDPVLGSAGSSQSWNRYSYVLNNPVNLIDPTGLATVLVRTDDGYRFLMDADDDGKADNSDPLKVERIEISMGDAETTIGFQGTDETFITPAAVSEPGNPSEPSPGDAYRIAWWEDNKTSQKFDNTRRPWSENSNNPFGPAMAVLSLSSSGYSNPKDTHLHGTNGPLFNPNALSPNDPRPLGGPLPSNRQFTHGCTRINNAVILALRYSAAIGTPVVIVK